MAEAIVLQRCIKCRISTGTADCEGCKHPFCTTHLIKHQKEISTKRDHHQAEHNLSLRQLLMIQGQLEISKNDILSRINRWEQDMFERIRCKAEQARERLIQLTETDEKLLIKTAEELVEKLQKNDEKKDCSEDDITQLQQSLSHLKTAYNKLNEQRDVDLYIEPSHMIDWNHLIYVREKPPTMIKKSTEQRKSVSQYDFDSSSTSSDDEKDSHETVSDAKEFYVILFFFSTGFKP